MLKFSLLPPRLQAAAKARAIASGYGAGSVDSNKSWSTRDFFDGESVTQDEIDAWVRAVAGIEPGTRRAAHYAPAYDVAGKIKAAKRRGDFQRILTASGRDDGFTYDA